MTGIHRRATLAGLAAAALAAPRVLRAHGSGEWQPTRPVQLVAGFAPGGGSDTIARTIAEGIVNLVGYKARAIVRQCGAESHAATWTQVSRRHTRKASVQARRY